MTARRPVCIGIAGRSCSGKTSIARRLSALLPGQVTIFGLDSYYHDLSHLPYVERTQFNFDHPDSLESQMLAEHLAVLREGQAIERPVYDFTTHTRAPGKSEAIEPGDYLIVEGLFTLYWPEVRSIFDARIFIAAEDPVCFERRKARDVRERARTPESIVAQYNATVRPGNESFVVPTQKFAHLVVNGEQPIELSAQEIFAFLEQRAGAPIP